MIPQKTRIDRFLEIHPEIRGRFPQLEKDIDGNPRTYLNSGAGTLMVDSAIHELARTAESANPQPGSVDPSERATGDLHGRVRQKVADLLNGNGPEEVSFHASATQALFNLAYAFRGILTESHNLVVTDLDHMANITPWEDMWGREKGCEIRRVKVTEEGRLDTNDLLSLVDRKTGIVALAMASNGFGTVVPLKEIIPRIRGKAPRCSICVDAVHHALHGPIDVQDVDCDLLVFSGYKMFGPMVGVLWGKASLLEQLESYRVETNQNKSPYKFEQGTLNNPILSSLEGAFEYLLWLGEALRVNGKDKDRSRRDRFRFAMTAIAEYETRLSRLILEGFWRLDPNRFRCYGIINPERFTERDPTFSFEIKGRPPEEIKKYLWEAYGIQIADGNHYSAAIYRHLGRESICRASFAHYDTLQTCQHFLDALESLLK
jgi:selenocysteine lyase/cysteine desulfurase